MKFIIPQLDSSQGQFTQVDINNLGEQAQEVINMLKSLGVIPNTSEQQQQQKRNIDRVSGLDAYRAANDAAKKAEEEYQNQIKKDQQAQTESKSDENFTKQNLTGIAAELMSQTEREERKARQSDKIQQDIQSVVEIMRGL